MQLHKTDHEHLRQMLANAGAFLTFALLEHGCPLETAENDVAWYDRQKSADRSGTPAEIRKLQPLLVALLRQVMWQESPSQLEAELEPLDDALPAAMGLVALRQRIDRHLAEIGGNSADSQLFNDVMKGRIEK